MQLADFTSLDQFLFHWINHGWSNPFLDWIMPVWREKTTWIPLYILCLFFLWKKFGFRFWFPVLMLVLAAGLADTASSKIIKPLVHRVRPCNDPDFRERVVLRIPCGSGYSFTSSHATNHFAFAVLFITFLGSGKKWWKVFFIAWAATIAIGQVYVGVHYPSDILAGAFLGSAISGAIFYLAITFFPRFLFIQNKP